MTEIMDYRIEYYALRADVERMGDVLAGLDGADTWGSMACGEVESIADVLRAVGRDQTADWIIGMHADSDEWDDMHHPDYDPESEV